MRILQKLLDNLGSLWNTLPKEVPFITIEKGTGAHSRVTVDGGMLYLHSQPYHKGIPQRQEVALDELTASEFVDVMQGMGYVVTYTSEAVSHGIDVHKPFILLEVTDVPLAATLTAYTSNLWKIMYPVYRVLREAEFDTSEAIKAWYRPLADGEWLDFWADFFNIRREPGEDDNNFSRRFTMWLFNPKTNNIALEELLSYRLQDRNIEVRDRAALQFELIVGTKYIADASDLHKILRETKGAGIEYFLNYQADLMEEQYPIHWADKHGKPFSEIDGAKPDGWELIRAIAEAYAKPSEAYFQELIRTMSESFPEPSEDHTFVYLKKFEEMFPDVSEEFTTAFAKVLADTYAGASEDGVISGIQRVGEETFPVPSESTEGSELLHMMSEAMGEALEEVLSTIAAQHVEAGMYNPAVYDDFTTVPIEPDVRIPHTTSGEAWDTYSSEDTMFDCLLFASGDYYYRYAALRAPSTSTLAEYLYAVLDSGMVDYMFEMEIQMGRANGTSTLVGSHIFRYVDENNYFYTDWVGLYSESFQAVSIYKRESGVDSLVATAELAEPITLSGNLNGDYIKVAVVQRHDMIAVMVNNKKVLEAEDSTFRESTRLGVFCRYRPYAGKGPRPPRIKTIYVESIPNTYSFGIETLSSEVYELPPESNVGISFETNSGEIRDEHELLASSSMSQETAFISITVDGEVVDSRIV